MNYRCNDCRFEFDEPARWQEERGEFWGSPAYETCYGCPNCYSGDVEEIKEDEE